MQIARWNEVFESSESRKLKTLSWVRIPTSFNSTGFQHLLDDFGPTDGAAIYGAWCALCSLAASAPEKSQRGLLHNSKGVPFSIRRIARLTGFAPEIFEKLIPWAIRVGWIIETTADTGTADNRTTAAESESPETDEPQPVTASADASGKSPGNLPDRGEERRVEEKRGRERESASRPPALPACVDYFRNELKAPESVARKFWNHYEARAWKLPRGQTVADWQALARSWTAKEPEFSRGRSPTADALEQQTAAERQRQAEQRRKVAAERDSVGKLQTLKQLQRQRRKQTA